MVGTGHGTTPADCNKYRWQDWVDHAERALLDLQSSSRKVFVGGQSMGALIALELATQHPELGGVIAYAPALSVTDWRAHFVLLLKYLTPTVAKPPEVFVDPAVDVRLFRYPVYPTAAAHEFLQLTTHTRRVLSQITCPLLVVETAEDTVTVSGSGQTICDEVRSIDKQLVTLRHSGHVVTLDAEWETAAAATAAFINRFSR